MKKYLSGLFTGIIICLSLTAFAANLNIIPNPYPVLINGTNTPVDGYNINDSTYLKLRDFEKAGLKVDFKNDNILVTSSTISTTTPEQTITNMEVDTMQTKVIYKVFVNNKEVDFDVPPINQNGDIYCIVVPVRNIVQANHYWDSQKGEFTLYKGSKSITFKEGIDIIKVNNRSFIPLKKAVEIFGGTYSNDGNNIIITINEEGK